MTIDAQKAIASEIESAMDDVLKNLDVQPAFSARFRQLIRNAINNNFDGSDVRSVIDVAPSEYAEGE